MSSLEAAWSTTAVSLAQCLQSFTIFKTFQSLREKDVITAVTKSLKRALDATKARDVDQLLVSLQEALHLLTQDLGLGELGQLRERGFKTLVDIYAWYYAYYKGSLNEEAKNNYLNQYIKTSPKDIDI
jgi:hypothetical protein